MPLRLLLCTDLDRTLLPNGPQAESPGARDKFRHLAGESGVTLVYVTGRDRGLVEQALDEYQLPHPDYVIADVGSTVYQLEQGNWLHWEQWQKEISPDWNGRTHDEIASLFADMPSLKLQEQSKQNTYKLSYYVDLIADQDTLIAEMHDILLKQAIRASLIWSVDELAAVGLIDVLPASASKRHAVEFLMEQLGFDLSNTVFAGDSGNDLNVMTSPIQSVLVANASEDVRNLARQQALNMGQSDALYFARGGFLGMNGNYSAGILEGVSHFMPEAKEIMVRHHD